MKIHFKISYYTHWGQRLLLSGNIPELGNGDLDKALALNFQYSEDWLAEIEINKPEDFQFTYKYVLYDENSGQFVEEWGNDRTVDVCPAETDHCFCMDSWNSPGSVENVFLTAPFHEVLLQHNHFTAKSQSTKKHTHLFKVKMPMLKQNEAVCLIGDCDILGNWSTTKSVVMSQTDGDWWTVELDLSKLENEVHYKYGVFDTEDNQFRY